MQPPAGRKEDSKLTRTLVLGALVAALLSKGTKARMKEEAKEERLEGRGEPYPLRRSYDHRKGIL